MLTKWTATLYVCQWLVYTVVSIDITAQSNVSGYVYDKYGTSMMNANVLLLNAKDSSLIKGSISSHAGAYIFNNISPGRYLIKASFVGYVQTFTSAFTIKDNTEVKVDSLKLIEKQQLKEVTVNITKPLFEQKIDRIIVNVSSSLTYAGISALDILTRSPGIIMDQQNNSLSMNGKNGVVIMINNKIMRMPISMVLQMLDGMPSGNIESIELITTPPASYDAEGNAGIINIILKTNAQFGTSGSLSTTVGYGKGWVPAASLNIINKRERLNIYGDFSYSRREQIRIINYYRKVIRQADEVESLTYSPRNVVLENFNGTVGLDYDLSNKTKIGFVASAFHNYSYVVEHNKTDLFFNKKSDSVIINSNKQLAVLYNYAGNLNLSHRTSTTGNLSVNFDYIHFKDRNPDEYLYSFYDMSNQFVYEQNSTSSKVTPITFWIANVEYSEKLTGKIDFQAGVKASISDFDNTVLIQNRLLNNWTTDADLSNRIISRDKVSAAFATFNIKPQEKTSIKAGLRYECTHTNLQSSVAAGDFTRRYGNLFPTIFLSQMLNKKSSINISYSKRITRPTFNDLAPFTVFVDPNTFFTGNPSLQPSISDAIKTDYLFKRFILSLSYTYQANPIISFASKIDPATNKQVLSAENQKRNQIASIVFSIPFNVTSWWSMQNNIIATWQQLNAVYNKTPISIANKSVNINYTQTFLLPENYTVELKGFYQTGGVFGMYKIKQRGTLDIGIQKKLADKRGLLRLSVSDIFGPPHFRPFINLPEQNLIWTGDFLNANRTIRVTYTRNFGSDKIKAKIINNSRTEDERQRVNSN